MAVFHQALVWIHVAAGFLGLAAFWIPVMAPKGRDLHVQAGRFFVRAAWIVIATAAVTAALRLTVPLVVDPLPAGTPPETVARAVSQSRIFGIFLLYLAIITAAGLQQGMAVLRVKRHGGTVRTPVHTALNVLSIVSSAIVIVVGIQMRQPILLALSPIGILGGLGALRYARRTTHTRMSWWYEHMGNMLGTGIAFHTAFFVFGANRLFRLDLDGMVAVLPWILPSLIGVPAIALWTSYYRRRFREA